MLTGRSLQSLFSDDENSSSTIRLGALVPLFLPLLVTCAVQDDQRPAAATQSKHKRDLQRSSDTGEVGISRSYALVVGISQYKYLPASAQLSFPDRDADLSNTILISAEGGQFPPENVHMLTNERASLPASSMNWRLGYPL